ncbi:NAD-dependent epimerase/dehydratase family protein [Thalassotalea piscium]|uniref:Nucleoside-diphosphate-sugar epimerase n=1 Tax=Thalassotalea piscium TaxID=1230533 RepID=A0A7X0NG11_9GAMM|nr:NAD-dependent epimerase/dehydratase family protein [Thalassotalea piscium]MBB6542778.1 nucleoside-diphosphate-sugar epimerase [Thalassotalea piscium]
MKTILVTGASGFTGRHFVSLANKLGYECVALCHKTTDRIEGCTSVVVADITNKTELKAQLCKLKPNFVVHLAAISFVPHGDVTDIYRANLIGTTNLIDCLVELKLPIEKVLVASSGNVYGNNTQLPIEESMPFTPVNDYAVSKSAMELALSVRFNQLPIIIVRPFNYTGVGQAEHFLIPKIVSAFKRNDNSIELGNLEVARDFSDVRDVVTAYIKLLESDVKSEVFNVCTGVATSLLSVINLLNEFSGYKINVEVNPDFVRGNEIKELYGDNTKLVKAIGEYQNYELLDTLNWMYKP